MSYDGRIKCFCEIVGMRLDGTAKFVGKIFARTILEEPIVLYRISDGSVVALEDRCCHRSLPLSRGNLNGDNLRCGYHGLLYNPKGNCISVPGQR